jgi:hypothetical protein
MSAAKMAPMVDRWLSITAKRSTGVPEVGKMAAKLGRE